MTNKEIYSEWIKTQERIPVFMQPWWLDAVCAGKEWDVIIVESQKSKVESSLSQAETPTGPKELTGDEQVSDAASARQASDEHPISTRSASDEHPMQAAEKEGENNGESVSGENVSGESVNGDKVSAEKGEGNEGEKEIVAAMPYMVCKKWWMKWIVMPQETQIGGIWLDENHEFSAEELTAVCQQVADVLAAKKMHFYYQQFPVGSPCPEIFKSLGFKIKERVTYRIDNLTNLDKVIDKFSKNKKRQLQKALSLHAESNLTAEEFYALHMLWLSLQKKQISYSREFFLVLEQKLRRHKQSQILTICNADHEPYAAALLVWDSQRMYYLIPCYNPEYKESGAGALLVLEAIKLAREIGVSFDFEGSMIRGVAQHYKQFGSLPNTYYSVEKYYKPIFRLMIWAQKLREWNKFK